MPSARAERQRSDVAHEDLRRVRVVPEEPERRADQRAAEHRQLRRLAGTAPAAGTRRRTRWPVDVGQRGEGGGGDRERADRQAVEAVGQVHGVRPGHQHEHRERQVAPAEIGNQPLEEREDQPGVVGARSAQHQQHDADRRPRSGPGSRSCSAAAGRDAIAPDDLQVVVEEADRRRTPRWSAPRSRRRRWSGRPRAASAPAPPSGSAGRPSSACRPSAGATVGPSWRITWPIWNSRSLRTIHGPSTRLIASADRLAAAVRNVM